MTASLHQYRERARAHQADLDLSANYFTPKDLSERWKISQASVRDIPRDLLPYKEFGAGALRKRRRYHPDDVFAYENRDRNVDTAAA